MFKKIIVLIFAIALLVNYCLCVNAVDLSAHSAVILDADTGEVVYEDNAHERMSMASTTKVMTAIIAVEYIEEYGDKTAQITADMLAVEGSSMGLKVGDRISLSSLVVGMLLPSGNDAATATAIFIGGSLEKFSAIMNDKASEIGMENSSFITPSGLDDDMHYSTAYDMAKLTAYAIQNKSFSDVFSAYQMSISYYSAENKSDITVSFTNHNQLLTSYENCTGGKTGYTVKSGRCLISTATKDDCTLVAVTLNDPNDWQDHVDLMEYGFSQIKEFSFPQYELQIPKASGGDLTILIFDRKINYITAKDIKRVVCLPRFLYADDLDFGQEIGTVKYYLDDKMIGEYAIIY